MDKRIIRICKKYINNTPSEIIYTNFYKDKEMVDVLVRYDAKEFTDDWVDTMDYFIDREAVVLEPTSKDLFGFDLVNVELILNNRSYIFEFHYKSLIPIELYNSLNRLSHERQHPSSLN